MPRNYATPRVDDQWIDSHCTHPAVARAIHAIADSKRSAEQIWEDPTAAEDDHVRMAVAEYIREGDFDWQPRFKWGIDSIRIGDPDERE